MTAPADMSTSSPSIMSRSPLMMPPLGSGMLNPPSAADTTARTGFFDLPAEIRIIIYHMSGLVADRQLGPKRIPDELLDYFKSEQKLDFWKPGKYLCTSKTFNDEVARLIYGSRRFYIPNGWAVIAFLQEIGSKNASYIRYLQVRTFGLTEQEAEELCVNHKDSLPALLEFVAKECSKLLCFKVNDIALAKYAEAHNARRMSLFAIGRHVPTIVTTSLVQIKSIVDTFPQLSNVSYRQGTSQLCMAAPGEEDSELIPQLFVRPIQMVPRITEYEPFDVDKEIAERDWEERLREEAGILDRRLRPTAARLAREAGGS